MKSFRRFLREQLILRTDGHYDVHKITPEHIAWIQSRPEVLNGNGNITLTIPDHLPRLPNALVGPASGDPPVADNHPDVYMSSRGGGRPYDSKMIRGEHRYTNMITVNIRRDDQGRPVLHTAYGGPKAHIEPNNPNLPPEQRKESEHFWSQHALLDGKK
jgi:hypothetical protein